MAFYGHLRRIKPKRVANKITSFQENIKTQALWRKEIHRDLWKSTIREEVTGKRNAFRMKIKNMKHLFNDKQNWIRILKVFSEEELTRISQRIEAYWRRWKKEGNKESCLTATHSWLNKYDNNKKNYSIPYSWYLTSRTLKGLGFEIWFKENSLFNVWFNKRRLKEINFNSK